MGIAERLPLSGTVGSDLAGGSRVVLTESVDEDESGAELVRPEVRLIFDKDLRNVGVSSDSRALGSSNLVYLPIEGLLTTYIKRN
jgi:hypothetical protein